MHVLTLVKDAVHTLRRHPSLWLFGFFAAAGGGTSVRSSGDSGPVPEWIVPAIAVALVLGAVALVVHVVSDAALIDGVRRTRRGERFTVRMGVRTGLSCFWRLALLKLSALAVGLVTAAVMLLPLGAALLAKGPIWAGALGSAALAITLIPWALSVYFVYEYAMRVAVVEATGVRASIRDAARFLRGRVLLSIQIAIAVGLGQFAAGGVGLLAALPVAAVAAVVYLLAGPIAAAIVFGAVMIPVAICIVGALGTYRSSVWTHGYLRGRGLPA
jgi:hypothetical protein